MSNTATESSDDFRVVEQRLSDRSVAFNVVGLVGVADPPFTITIGAMSRAHAEAIAEALNDGAAWTAIDCPERDAA